SMARYCTKGQCSALVWFCSRIPRGGESRGKYLIRSCNCHPCTRLRCSAGVRPSLVVGELFPACDGEGNRNRVHVGKPAPDDYHRGSDDQWRDREVVDRWARHQSDGGERLD